MDAIVRDMNTAASIANWPEDVNLRRKILAIVVRVVRRFESRHPDAIAPEAYGAVEAHLRNVLDLDVVPAAAKKTVLLPIWPMTLAQLRAAVDDPERATGIRLENPAPRMKIAQRFGEKSRAYFANRAMYQDGSPVHPDSAQDRAGVDGIAWRLAAPEGFPPYPRRGGVYSRDEAGTIDTWLRDTWPALGEARMLVQGADDAITDAGYDGASLHRVIGYSDLRSWFEENLKGNVHHAPFPAAEGKSPKELLRAALVWAKVRLFPYLDAVLSFDVRLLERWPDPDAHMVALHAHPITAHAGRDVARNIYQVTPYHVDWMEPIVGKKGVVPLEHVWTRPEDAGSSYHRYFPLSQILALQARYDENYKRAEKARGDAADVDRAKAVELLRVYLERGGTISTVGLRRALPGFRVETEQRGRENAGACVRGPSGEVVAYGQGRTITDALTQLVYGKRHGGHRTDKGLASA